jgi:hypothetical protein
MHAIMKHACEDAGFPLQLPMLPPSIPIAFSKDCYAFYLTFAAKKLYRINASS